MTKDLNAEISTVAVTVGGQRISVRTDKGEAYLLEIAKEVDDCVNELKKSAPTASTLQVFAYVLIQFADRLHETQTKLAGLMGESIQKADSILRLIEEFEQEKDPVSSQKVQDQS